MTDGAAVLLIDDHAILSHTVADSLRRAGFVPTVLDPTRLDDEAILAAGAAHPGAVVLLDLHLGDRSSTDLVAPLSASGAVVVLLTASEDDAAVGEAIEAGAVGVVHKSVPFHDLVDTIARVAAGDSIMTAARRAQLVEAARAARRAGEHHQSVLAGLTAAEEAVLAALIAGHGLRDIAEQRFVGIETVRSQVKAILRKLGARNQVQALAIAREAGFGGHQPR